MPVEPAATDLLRWPVVGRLLRWRHLRTATQLTLALVALIVVLHGFFGPTLAPTNLAAVLTWVHYRGLLIGALLAVGNVFCGACPMILVRDAARRVHAPARHWPRRAGLEWAPGWAQRFAPKWIALALFAAVLFTYELFDLWALPAATAWLVAGYFVAALVVDLTFKGAAFCKHVCPVGQFNFIASTLSPLEVRIRERGTCESCHTADCLKGRRDTGPPPIAGRTPIAGAAPAAAAATASAAVVPVRSLAQRGCELGLFLPAKVGNLDCTFCLDCVQACPYDNVAIGFRVPGEELIDDGRRSAIGRLSARSDLAALALLFTFGALINAFGMIAPAYALEQAIASALGTTSETLVLGIVFIAGLGMMPLALCGGAAMLTRWLVPAWPYDPWNTIVRFAYALVPFGAGVWLAHYGFHLLTGAGTIVPVVQRAALDLAGSAILGEPDWRWLGMRPGEVFPLQLGVVLLGAMGALVLAQRIAERDHPRRSRRAVAPWWLLVIGLTLMVVWILAQPMEMRGTDFTG